MMNEQIKNDFEIDPEKLEQALETSPEEIYENEQRLLGKTETEEADEVKTFSSGAFIRQVIGKIDTFERVGFEIPDHLTYRQVGAILNEYLERHGEVHYYAAEKEDFSEIMAKMRAAELGKKYVLLENLS